MLVLSRREDESIVFPGLGIQVRVLKVSGQSVKIGVDAPRRAKVLRGELAGAQDLGVELLQECVGGFAAEVRPRLAEAAEILRDVSETIDECNWQDAQPLLNRLFLQLKWLDTRARCMIGEVPQNSTTRTRALIVEDNDNEAKLLASYLRLKNIDVETVPHGAAAISALTRPNLPQAIVLDMRMPCYDGRWTVNRLRSDPRFDDIKIYAVSGDHPNDFGVEIGPTGVNQWLRKPVNPEELARQIVPSTFEYAAGI
ncbi:MAG: carbon storage regulator [Planctomycetales bacterium]|nr:carbon storage regulator [Planctomycetales bacterium]